ncbi:MAG: hypothetical protein ABSH52_28355, partial [Terriglobia bacterium]
MALWKGGASAPPLPEARRIGPLKHFHLLCSVSGAKKEAFAVCGGNGLEGLFRCLQQLFFGP